MTPLARPGATFVLFALLVVVLLPVTVLRAREQPALLGDARVAGVTVTADDERDSRDVAVAGDDGPVEAVEPPPASVPEPAPSAPDAEPTALDPPVLAVARSTTTCLSADLACVAFAGYDGRPMPGLAVDGAGHSSTNYVAHRLARAVGAGEADRSLAGVLYPLVPAGDWDEWTVAGVAPPGVEWSVAVTPRPGDVAQWDPTVDHPEGHVAWVDQVGVDASGVGYVVVSASTGATAANGDTTRGATVRVLTSTTQDPPDRYLRPSGR